jgi:hypothetical protein
MDVLPVLEILPSVQVDYVKDRLQTLTITTIIITIIITIITVAQTTVA